MDYYKSIEELHQYIRVFIESQEPTYKVLSIKANLETRYQATLESQGEFLPRQNFILTEIQAEFRVASASIGGKFIDYVLYMLSDGSLRIADKIPSIYKRV